MLFYNQYARPEDLDEIGERVLKEYFPSGRLDDNTHSNAVNVINLISIFIILEIFILIYNIWYIYEIYYFR